MQEVNADYAMTLMRSAGVRVGRVAFTPDSLDAIASEVRTQSEELDVVITSGGVGPTHDDVTIRAVCQAFGVPMVHNAVMEERILKATGSAELSGAQRQMCLLPQGVMLLDDPTGASKWPVLRMCNVFVLPGIPQFFRAKMDIISANFVKGLYTSVHRQVFPIHSSSLESACPLFLYVCF